MSVTHFLIGCLNFSFVLFLLFFLCILDTDPSLDVRVANMFPQLMTFLSILLTESFTEREFLVFTQSGVCFFFLLQ